MAFVIKAFVNRADKDPNIGLIEKISYGLGDFSSQLLLTPVSMLFMYYATEYVDIGMAEVGFIMMISRVFDGVSDLLVGYVNGAESQSEQAMNAILAAHTIIPPIMFIVAIVALSCYKLDKIYDDVIRELKLRHLKEETAA